MDSAFLKSLQLYNGPRLILEAERLFASQERIVGGGLQMDSQLLTWRPSTSTPSFRLPDFVIYFGYWDILRFGHPVAVSPLRLDKMLCRFDKAMLMAEHARWAQRDALKARCTCGRARILGEHTLCCETAF